MWRVANLGCTLLFILFSFCYLYWMQPDLLACFQYTLSEGLTSYSPLIGGLIITLLLAFLGELLAFTWPLPMPYMALSFLPSALILAFITGGNPVNGTIEFTQGQTVSFVVWAAVGILCILLLRKYASLIRQDQYSFTDSWPNLLLLLMLFLFVGGWGNTDVSLHRQLKSERLLYQDKYDEIIGLKTHDDTLSHTSGAIRALSLAKEHRLGEELFRVPQSAGASVLLVRDEDFCAYDSLSYKFYKFWGARPGKFVSCHPEMFFELVLNRNLCDSLVRQDIADYYLCSLLLERKLDRFAAEVSDYYPVNDSLPRHYKEALILYKRIRTTPVCVYTDESLEENFNDYQAMMHEKASKEELRNKTRRAFGRTYWYYYNDR